MLKNLYPPSFFTEIVAYGLREGVSYLDIYLEEKEITGIGEEENKIEKIVSGKEIGLGVRLVSAEETVYGQTDELTRESLKSLIDSLLKTLSVRGKIKPENFVSFKGFDKIIESSQPVGKRPGEIALEEKVKLVESANRRARERGKQIRQVSVSYGEGIKRIMVANSLGVYCAGERVYTNFGINVVAGEGSILQSAREIVGGLEGYELFDRYRVEELAAKSAGRALDMLKAPKCLAGPSPVVLAAEAGGTLIHEAIGHSLEADAIQKGISPAYLGKIGKQVASEQITVLDDPTLRQKRGSYSFDDEGTPSQKTILVEKGVLKGYLYDWFTANKDKTVSTGNGRRESYHCKPLPRMSNTYIAPGTGSPLEIIRSVEKGLLVKKMGGGQVNTATGDFVFEVEEGYALVDGQVRNMVRGATLIGNGPEILNSIDLVGNDLGWNIGTCGKEGQGVPVCDGQPTLRIPQIIVGGSEEKK